jgi:hypothetical protein
MLSDKRQRLIDQGCKSVPAKRTPISFGAGFLRTKRIERYRARTEAAEVGRCERDARRRALNDGPCAAISPCK